MDLALIQNLKVLANVPDFGDIRIISNEPAWPPEPDMLPEDMTITSHSLHEDNRWTSIRPVLRLLSGDTSYAIVNYLMIMTRALELHQGQPNITVYVAPAIDGIQRLQDTTYANCKFVKLALLTCRCAWNQFSSK